MQQQSKIDELISQVLSMIETAKQSAESTSSKDIKDQLYEYVDEAQSYLNVLLKKSGVITQEQLNDLDEQIRTTKQELLYNKATQSQRKMIIGAVAVVGIVGLLLFISKK